jgi:uncharacterized membrane protein (UPF0127 family)
MADPQLAPRLRRLPVATVVGREVPVATGFRARLLGLAGLERAEAGAGLLIPRCSSVHTFGMRFALDLHFLGESGEVVRVLRGICARRIANCRGASAVLEVPADEGGEFPAAGP